MPSVAFIASLFRVTEENLLLESVPKLFLLKVLTALKGTHFYVLFDMEQWVLKLYNVCINDYPELTLTYFTARSNFVTYARENL